MPADPAPPTPDARDATLRRLLRIAWSYRADCLQLLGLQLAVVFLTVAVVALAGVGIDFVRHCADRTVPAPALPFFVPADATDKAVFVWLGAGILVAAVLRATLAFVFGLVSVRFLHGRIVVNLRSQVFAKLQQLSFRFFDSNASGSIINRVTSDAHAIRLFIEGVVLQLAIIALTLAACAAYMFRTDWRLTLACLSVLPFQVWFAIRFSRKVRPAYEENRELMDRMVLGFSENVQGIQVVKGFALEPRVQGRFAGWSEAIRVQKRKVFTEVALFWPVIDALNRLSMAVLIGYGGWMVARGELALGTGLVAFAGLLQQFSAQVTTLASVVDNAQVSLAGAKRIFEILDTDPGVETEAGASSPGRFVGRVAFENVSFEFQDNATVLRDLSFVAEPGQRIAIAGATGAGKSALLSLIPRFYDPRSGRVTLDGHDDEETETSLDELALLIDTAGADVAGRLVQRRDTPDHTWYVGKGKAEELRDLCLAVDADTVVFDNELSPGQQYNLEKLLGRTAIDRTAVILDIFAQNAHTLEGKAQVELALLRYRLPR
ncbi:MAG: hypothetical protein RI910_2614, partial [Verrucomicrobiota bacterium]